MLSPAELQKFEAPLIALANVSGGDLRKLFYAFFSFLNRRTDFYCILPSDGSSSGGRMGFREGQAEQILLASFRQFPLRKVGPKPAGPGGGGTVTKKSSASAAPAAVGKQPKKTAPKVDKTAAVASADEPKLGNSDNKDDKKIDGRADISTSEATAKEKSGNTKNDSIRYTEEGKQIPIGNGGSTPRYVWTQTLEEVTVHVPLPEGVRGKDLDVKICANSLSIRRKNGNLSGVAADTDENIVPIEIEGMLFGKIRPSESTWTLEATTHASQKVTTLQLILDKVQKTWWSTVLSGDTPLVDTTMVDSTRHIGTYDDETQAQIRKIMFDQRQERLGLKTSSQIMLEDLPPMPNGENFKGEVSLPAGVEYIDGETLDKASIKSDKK